nr:MAG: hypothetical protein [Porcellio scaber clopovirus]
MESSNPHRDESTSRTFNYDHYCESCLNLLKKYVGNSPLEGELVFNTLNVVVTTTLNGKEKNRTSENSSLIHKIKLGRIIDITGIAVTAAPPAAAAAATTTARAAGATKATASASASAGATTTSIYKENVIYQTFLKIFDLYDQENEKGEEMKTSRSPEVNPNCVADVLKNASENDLKNIDHCNKPICFKICEYNDMRGQDSLLPNEAPCHEDVACDKKLERIIETKNKITKTGEGEEKPKAEIKQEEKQKMSRYFSVPISAHEYSVKNKNDDSNSIIIYTVTLLSNAFFKKGSIYFTTVNNDKNYIGIVFNSPTPKIKDFLNQNNVTEACIKWLVGSDSCRIFISYILNSENDFLYPHDSLPLISLKDFISFLNIDEDSNITSDFYSTYTSPHQFFENNNCRLKLDNMVRENLKLYLEMVRGTLFASSLQTVSTNAMNSKDSSDQSSSEKTTISIKNNPSLYLKLLMGKRVLRFSDENLKDFYDSVCPINKKKINRKKKLP